MSEGGSQKPGKMKTKTIKVTPDTWRILQRLRIERGYKTVEDVIVELLKCLER
jgi:hypothetical protein